MQGFEIKKTFLAALLGLSDEFSIQSKADALTAVHIKLDCHFRGLLENNQRIVLVQAAELVKIANYSPMWTKRSATITSPVLTWDLREDELPDNIVNDFNFAIPKLVEQCKAFDVLTMVHSPLVNLVLRGNHPKLSLFAKVVHFPTA